MVDTDLVKRIAAKMEAALAGLAEQIIAEILEEELGTHQRELRASDIRPLITISVGIK